MARAPLGRPVSRPLFALAFLGLVTLAATGCGPGWSVIKASGPPSAIRGAKRFAIAADYSGLTIGKKTEAEYLAEKDEGARTSWEGDKRDMHAEVAKEAAARLAGYDLVAASGAESGPDVVLVTVHYRAVEPGTYTAMYNIPTTVVARLIFSREGTVVDEIEVTVSQSADIYHPSSGQRMRNCGEMIGAKLGSFVLRANK